MNMQSRVVVCFFSLTFAITSGCESKPSAIYSTLGLVAVSGRITLNGQPLAKAVVTFDDAQDGSFSYGLTDANGKYKLRIDSDMWGAKPGKKIVRISTARQILGLNTSEEGGENSSEKQALKSESAKEIVPEKFGKRSELSVEVSPSSKTFNFDLK